MCVGQLRRRANVCAVGKAAAEAGSRACAVCGGAGQLKREEGAASFDACLCGGSLSRAAVDAWAAGATRRRGIAWA